MPWRAEDGKGPVRARVEEAAGPHPAPPVPQPHTPPSTLPPKPAADGSGTAAAVYPAIPVPRGPSPGDGGRQASGGPWWCRRKGGMRTGPKSSAPVTGRTSVASRRTDPPPLSPAVNRGHQDTPTPTPPAAERRHRPPRRTGRESRQPQGLRLPEPGAALRGHRRPRSRHPNPPHLAPSAPRGETRKDLTGFRKFLAVVSFAYLIGVFPALMAGERFDTTERLEIGMAGTGVSGLAAPFLLSRTSADGGSTDDEDTAREERGDVRHLLSTVGATLVLCMFPALTVVELTAAPSCSRSAQRAREPPDSWRSPSERSSPATDRPQRSRGICGTCCPRPPRACFPARSAPRSSVSTSAGSHG